MTKVAFKVFQDGLSLIQTTLQKLDHLEANGELTSGEAELAYAGCFLSAVTAFEVFAEAVFFHVLNGGGEYGTGTRSLVTFTAGSSSRAIAFGGNDYVDWLPLDRCLKRAQRFLKDGKPFSLWTDTHTSRMKDVVTIRHAIAHASTYSIKKFQDEIIGNTVLSKNHQRLPAGFLRSRLGSGKGARISAYLGHIADAATVIAPK